MTSWTVFVVETHEGYVEFPSKEEALAWKKDPQWEDVKIMNSDTQVEDPIRDEEKLNE